MKSGYLWGLLALLWAQERYCPVDKVFLRWSTAQRTQQVEDTGDTLWVPVVFHVIAE